MCASNKTVFVNLKRFDVPRSMGGLCPADSDSWITDILQRCVARRPGRLSNLRIVWILPESLIPTARKCLDSFSAGERQGIGIGCQSVFRHDVVPGGNFGALTSAFPAAAARALGCDTALIGHSEERRDKQEILEELSGSIPGGGVSAVRAATNRLLNRQVHRALERELDVLFCVGETAEERGGGTLTAQRTRVEAALQEQIEQGLVGIGPYLDKRDIVIGYEPVWAIGPGRTPPGREEIAFVSERIGAICERLFGQALPVVYGGGVKEENAAEIAGIETLSGGLVALTRFSGEIGFYMDDFVRIVERYVEGCAECKEGAVR